MEQLFYLPDVVEVEVLQEIQDQFAEATGLAAVIVDHRGKPVTRYSKFTTFCRKIRQSPEHFGCERSDARGGLEAVSRNEPFIYKCHAGLVDLAAPIVVHGQYLGSILSGQIVMQPEEMKELPQPVTSPVTDREVDGHHTPEFREIPVVPRPQVEASAQLMYVMANYIVEKGVGSIIQKQLHEKNLRIMEEVRARAELEKALKESELKALQSQVNPHFLFNTLNTISRLALVEKASDTQQVVYALAQLLRYSLRRVDGAATLEDELDHVRKYLMIQEVRFGDRIEAEIDAEPRALTFEVPPMTVQPLVENAVDHGLEPAEEGGKVWVRARLDQGELVLTVADNGRGMTGERLEQVQSWLSAPDLAAPERHIGLINVVRRLQHFFGSRFRWHLTSTSGIGTRVDLHLPQPGSRSEPAGEGELGTSVGRRSGRKGGNGHAARPGGG